MALLEKVVNYLDTNEFIEKYGKIVPSVMLETIIVHCDMPKLYSEFLLDLANYLGMVSNRA